MGRVGSGTDALTVVVYLPLMFAAFLLLVAIVGAVGLSPLQEHQDQWVFAVLHGVVLVHLLLLVIGVRAALALVRPPIGPPTSLQSWWGRARRSVLLWWGILALVFGVLALVAGLDSLATAWATAGRATDLVWSLPLTMFGAFLVAGGWRAVRLGRARLRNLQMLLASGARADGSLIEVTRQRVMPATSDVLNIVRTHISFAWTDRRGVRHVATEDIIDDPYDHWSDRVGVVAYDPERPECAAWIGRDASPSVRPSA